MVGFVEQGGPLHVERPMFRADDTPSWVTDHAAWRDAVAEVERDCGPGPEPAPPRRRITPADLDVSGYLRAMHALRSLGSGIVLEGGDTWIEKPPPPPPVYYPAPDNSDIDSLLREAIAASTSAPPEP